MTEVHSVYQELEAAAQSTADRLNAVTSTNPLETADYSGPLTPITPGGVDVAAGSEVQIIAATSGRVKVKVCHAGAEGSGRLWLGLGQTATTGTGLFLDPEGPPFEEFYAGSVRVRNTGAGAVRVTWMEWGA